MIGRSTNSGNEQRRKAHGYSIFVIMSLVWIPAMLAWNIWGTILVEQMMERELGQCVYVGFAQSFQLLFLISTYCLVFIYGIFLFVVRECMKRYYIAIEMNPAILRTSFSPPADLVAPVFKGRSKAEMQDALAYTIWFLVNANVGSRADRNYLEEERARIRFEKMSGSLSSYCYDRAQDENS